VTSRFRHPIAEAPKDGTPIIAVCGGVEACVCWHDPLPGVLDPGWFHWDDDEMCASDERVRGAVTEWRKMF
jgi:hypothetical protein